MIRFHMLPSNQKYQCCLLVMGYFYITVVITQACSHNCTRMGLDLFIREMTFFIIYGGAGVDVAQSHRGAGSWCVLVPASPGDSLLQLLYTTSIEKALVPIKHF